MTRLRRFEEHRFLGFRSTMRYYDMDDPTQSTEMETQYAGAEDTNPIQTFGPDTAVEARNRGFRPAKRHRAGA